jgi:hypothetical protein
MRKPIPENLRSKILIANRHSCCICRKGDVQIHHINGDHSDNKIENLAVLCLEHHDKATSPKGLSASLTSDQIRTYKTKWESECESISHLISRSCTAFFMVDYENAERIRQLYAQLSLNELKQAYYILRKEIIEEDRLRKEQHFDISMEPNLAWRPWVVQLIEEIKKGDPQPEPFKSIKGHPSDPLYPDGPAFVSSHNPMYDMWCQIMVRCLILTKKTYDIENLMKLEYLTELDLAGSLVTFNGRLRGKVEIPYDYKKFPLCYTNLKIKRDNICWISRIGIKTHYVYSSTAADSLSGGRGNGVLLFRGIDKIKKIKNIQLIRFSCTPLIIGSGGGGTLNITQT